MAPRTTSAARTAATSSTRRTSREDRELVRGPGAGGAGVGAADGRPAHHPVHARREARGDGRRRELEGDDGGEARADLVVVQDRRQARGDGRVGATREAAGEGPR